ncbi:unnamed protein product [Aureobasidium uvarum]|uniref:Uncharacterized protein n=1 Tax=Aureobasidium uvarum TaxID=2773716 RepID=A0A9N8KEQ2_9PEZI|nr:unnamed protein product [Aureobasidium uvarum]
MPYHIPHVRDLNPRPPRMLIGHRVLKEDNPLRRWEEQKRVTWARDYAYMRLMGMIPDIEPSRGRPARRLPRPPLPPGSHAPKVLRKPLPLELPAPPAPPTAPGPSTPRPRRHVLHRSPTAALPIGRSQQPIIPATIEPFDATWKRVFGRIPPRVLASIPEDTNNINMVPRTTADDDLCLVPPGSENAVPTVRGIIEEYYEEQEYEQTSVKEKRTPVYLSPKEAQYAAEAIRRSNLNRPLGASTVRLPPKAKQLLGSPRAVNNNSDWHHSTTVEQSPLHSKGKSVNSLRHSASSRLSSLLTPTKARKLSTSSLAHSKALKHASSSSHHTAISHSRKTTTSSSSSSPLKHSCTRPSISAHINMSAQPSPTEQATAGALSNKSPSESSVSPTKSTASPKKEDFSLKRTLSNVLTPKHKREDVPPPLPKKDTPPPVTENPTLSATIVDVRGPSDAYSGNGFAATAEGVDAENKPDNKSRETITVAFGDDECSPIKAVKSGVVKMTHQPYSPFVGQKAVFEADPKLVKEIDEEFQSPPMPTALFRSPKIDKHSPKSAEKAKTPRYIAGGLLEGGLLPATTYQPPKVEEKAKAKTEIYSPSLYSVANGHDVFRTSSYDAAAQESTAAAPAPPNSPTQSDGTDLSRPHVEPIKYVKAVKDNEYVYRPEDHVFNRYRGETRVFTHDFATAGAEQKQAVPAARRVNTETPANKYNGYGGLDSSGRSGRSVRDLTLRDRFKETGGLGIELSENVADYYYNHDNGTTLGVDGDGNFERGRETALMRSPDYYVKQGKFDTTSQPLMSEDHLMKQLHKEMGDSMYNLHEHQLHRISLVSGKVDRLANIGFRNQDIMNATRHAVDHIFADNRKSREDLDAILAENRKLRKDINAISTENRKHREAVDVIAANQYLQRETLDGVLAENRKMRESLSDISEHVLDNEKLDHLVDKIVERIHPTIVRGHEKDDMNTERILARIDMTRGNAFRAFPASSAGHFTPSSNGFFSPSSRGFRNPYAEYTEEPSKR